MCIFVITLLNGENVGTPGIIKRSINFEVVTSHWIFHSPWVNSMFKCICMFEKKWVPCLTDVWKKAKLVRIWSTTYVSGILWLQKSPLKLELQASTSYREKSDGRKEGLKGINAIQQLKIYLLSKSHMTGMTLLTMLRLTLYSEIASHLSIANIKHLTSCSYSTPFVFSKDINTVRKKSVVGFFSPYYFLPWLSPK